jgi:hypothetical protein
MNNLYEALEICLKEIEQGADVDTVLFRYPDLADELRPILEASVKAKAMAIPAPSQDVMRRNRAKVLQRAAELREGKGRSQARRIWSVPLRRALVTFMVVLTLFVSGTGLVGAASNTLPGDNLYPVKRTWEGIRLFLTFDLLEREALELEHENERLEELYELFAMGRSAEVDFAGYVTRQTGNEWRVSGITVLLSAETRLPDQQVTMGAAVRVRGQTQGDQIVLAERIELLSSGIKLPEVEDDGSGLEEEDNENSNQSLEDDSGRGTIGETLKVKATKTPKPEFKPEMKSFEGIVSSIKNTIIVVDGITMDLSLAEEIKGTPGVGVIARVEGYYNANGVFIVVKIEFKNESSGSDSGSNSNDDNSNDDGNDDNSNDDDGNDNDNEDDNDGDNSGSDDGGGDDNGADGDNSNDSDDDD